MPDRENVIRELETLGAWHTHHYAPFHYEAAETIHDAIALLREQEPVRPETVVRTGIREEPTIQALVCGNCHKIMGYCVVYNFCPWCGRAVKFDD